MERKYSKAYCVKCGSLQMHIDLYEVSGIEDPEDCYNTFTMIQCYCCNNVSFKVVSLDYNNIENIEDSVNNSGFKPMPSTYEHYYPNALEGHEILNNFIGVPKDVFIAYHQTIKALQGDSFLLTSIGFRIIIEAICLDKKVKVTENEGLYSMVDSLLKKGFITKVEWKRIHAIRYLGNASAHDIVLPEKDQLLTVLDVINHLLKNLYIIDAQLETKIDTIIETEHKLLAVLKDEAYKLTFEKEGTLKELIGKRFKLLSKDLDLNKFEKNLKMKIKANEVKFIKLGERIKNEGNQWIQKYVLIKSQFPPFYNPDFENE